MAAIPMEMRVRIYRARMSGETTTEVADRFEVSPAFVRRLMQRHRETKSLAPLKGKRGPKPKLDGHRDRLRKYVSDHPDHTPAEVAAALRLKVSALTVWRALRALGLTFKKSRSTPPSETGRT
jgi:transposase